jgi:hypothetical protein
MEMSTAFDFSRLDRSMIGVDRLADLAEAALRGDADASHPPFDGQAPQQRLNGPDKARRAA